jgi:aminopeptidase
MDKVIIEKYAELIVKAGIALKKGQDVVIRTDVSQEEMAALVSKVCYQNGARRVYVHFQSAKLDRVDYDNAVLEDLFIVPPFEEAAHKFMADDLPCLIWLDGDDPDGLKGVDASKVAAVRAAKYKIVGKYREARENKFQWCIAGVPSLAWARKVFPALTDDKAMEALWKAILSTSRALDGNGLKNWEAHDADLKKRCAYLNSFRFKELRYSSSNGTDFRVGLIPGVIFLGGGEKTLSGTYFQPNIPSEECFTSPRKGVAEGIVYASKPLAYQGQLIEDFSVRFHDGKAVEVHAKKGEEALRSILTLDPGSAYLGECALVPFHSPINETGILFFNTLYDENAACHLALGNGFTELYPGFETLGDEEVHKRGINQSLSHVDFMIGSKDMAITGIAEDGREIAIFRNGDWAF